jgi:hypothetical protein
VRFGSGEAMSSSVGTPPAPGRWMPGFGMADTEPYPRSGRSAVRALDVLGRNAGLLGPNDRRVSATVRAWANSGGLTRPRIDASTFVLGGSAHVGVVEIS